MDPGLRQFESKPLTLVVGPEATELYIPRAVLSQISYFEAAIPDDAPVDYCFKMPNADPTTVADILYFTMTKSVPPLEEPVHDEDEWEPFDAVVTRYVKAYVMAKSWEVQWLRKSIRELIVIYCRRSLVNPNDIVVLHEAELQDSLLYKFLVAQLAHNIAFVGLTTFMGEFPNFDNIFKSMPTNFTWEMLKWSDFRSTCRKCDKLKKPSDENHWISDQHEEAQETA